METIKTEINVQLETLDTWNNIPEIGQNVSGLGHYEATFNWDASAADGAYLNFGDTLESSMKVWINGQKVGGDVSQNPTKAPASIVEGYEGTEQYTGGVSWTKPIVDISEYLVDGENTIVIEYSSILSNYQLSRGAITERENAAPARAGGGRTSSIAATARCRRDRALRGRNHRRLTPSACGLPPQGRTDPAPPKRRGRNRKSPLLPPRCTGTGWPRQ